MSEQYNELIANQKSEGSEQNVARKSDFQDAGAQVKVMFRVTSCQVQSVSEKTLCQNPGGGGVLPYMGSIGMCCCEGYGFQTVYSRIGYINQNICV